MHGGEAIFPLGLIPKWYLSFPLWYCTCLSVATVCLAIIFMKVSANAWKVPRLFTVVHPPSWRQFELHNKFQWQLHLTFSILRRFELESELPLKLTDSPQSVYHLFPNPCGTSTTRPPGKHLQYFITLAFYEELAHFALHLVYRQFTFKTFRSLITRLFPWNLFRFPHLSWAQKYCY